MTSPGIDATTLHQHMHFEKFLEELTLLDGLIILASSN